MSQLVPTHTEEEPSPLQKLPLELHQLFYKYAMKTDDYFQFDLTS